MTLAQLGEEYLGQEKILRGRIDRLTLEGKSLRGRQKCELSRRIAALYEMARDSHRIGLYLIRYYHRGMYEGIEHESV